MFTPFALVLFDQPLYLVVRQHLDLLPVPGPFPGIEIPHHARTMQPHTHPGRGQSGEVDHLAERAWPSGELIKGIMGLGLAA